MLWAMILGPEFCRSLAVPQGGDQRTLVPSARVEATIGYAVFFSRVYMGLAALSNCHMLTLSYLATSRKKAAFMPAFARPHCIFSARDLRMPALDYGLCRRSAIFGVFYSLVAESAQMPPVPALKSP